MLDDEEWDALQDLEGYVKGVKLPTPIQNIYLSYISWNRNSDSFFNKLQWLKDKRTKDFGLLRKEFGKEISKKEPRLELLNAKVVEQVALLKSLLEQPPKGEKKGTVKPKKSWRNIRLTYIIAYLILCSVIDILLLPLIQWYILGIISIEIAIFFGLPRMIEWVRMS